MLHILISIFDAKLQKKVEKMVVCMIKCVTLQKIIDKGMKRDIKALLHEVEKKLVKRIHERPSREALDHLALFVGFQDWDSFQKELHESLDDEENQTENNTK